MELTKETLKHFLQERPAITPRSLAMHAGVHENAINQLYNKSNRSLSTDLKQKLMDVLPLYGWR